MSIMCNVAARSWAELRTYEGVVYRTFEEAARARNLLDGYDEYEFLPYGFRAIKNAFARQAGGGTY